MNLTHFIFSRRIIFRFNYPIDSLLPVTSVNTQLFLNLSALFSIPVFYKYWIYQRFHHFTNKCFCYLSISLHNTSLPLDKTNFPSARNLFFATGTIDPP